MARLIPNINIDEIDLKPERDVARALVESLPNECIIYHSYPWLKTDRNDRDGSARLREGETDFVIILPSHGLLILEVKGGIIEFNPVDHGWYRKLRRDRRKAIQDPFEQARRNTYYLIDQCVEKFYQAEGRVPFVFGYAVIFPDCDHTGPAPPGAEPAIVLSARDLPYMDRRIKDVLQKWNPSGRHRTIEKDDQAVIKNVISPAFKLLPVLFRQIEEEAEKLFQLTEDQIRLLDFLSGRDKAAIEGVAGSGKTMLARAQAQRFADDGKRVLFLCYNKALAQWLRESTPEEYSDRIVIRNFHLLCREWCTQAKINFSPLPGDQEEFWKNDAPDLLLEASEIITDRFDAIVVDEAQDFYPNWWPAIQMLNLGNERGSMYAFFDPAQNLFVDVELHLPELGEPFLLPTNCRNTKKIAAACGDIIDVDINTRPMAPEGADVKYIHAPDKSSQEERIGDLLHEWINKGNISTTQVVILSPVRWENSSLPKKGHIRNVPITLNVAEWREGHGVLYSTIRAFKGLEADIIIVSDVPLPEDGSKFTKNDLYVACSRAKHRLVVVSKDQLL